LPCEEIFFAHRNLLTQLTASAVSCWMMVGPTEWVSPPGGAHTNQRLTVLAVIAVIKCGEHKISSLRKLLDTLHVFQPINILW